MVTTRLPDAAAGSAEGPAAAPERPVLVPATGDDPGGVLRLAADIARSRDRQLVVLLPLTLARHVPLTRPGTADAGAEVRQLVEQADLDEPEDPAVHGLVGVGRSRAAVVRRAVGEHGVEVIVVEDGPSSPVDALRGAGLPSVDCDVVAATRGEAFGDVASILVPVAGGPHSGLAVDVALAIARAHGAWIDLLHVVEPDPDDGTVARAERYLEAGVRRMGSFSDVDTWTLEADDVTTAVAEQSRYYGLTVIGAPRKGRLREFVFGSTTGEVCERAEGTVLTVRSSPGNESWLDRWLPGPGW